MLPGGGGFAILVLNCPISPFVWCFFLCVEILLVIVFFSIATKKNEKGRGEGAISRREERTA